MSRRGQAGVAAAIVCAALLAASGGMLLARAAGSGPSPSVRATLASVRSAARRLDHVDAAQTAYGLTAGVATDLLALHALRDDDGGALDVYRPAAATSERMVTRSQLVDTVTAIQAQLVDAARKLVVPDQDRAAVRAATTPFDADTTRGLRAGTLTLDAAPYAAALQWMQSEVTRGRDEATQARAQIAHADLPPAQGRDVASTILGGGLVLLALALAVVLVVGVSHAGDLRRGAFTDALTRAANRRQLEQDLDGFDARTERHVAVLMVDIDHFKTLNDTAGHPAGDGALARVATVVAACLRRGDTLYRYGGEEFCVLLPDTTDAQAAAVADRIRATVEAVPVEGEERLPGGRLTVSIGVAGGASPNDVIGAADRALYEAKQQGRNRVATAVATDR